MAFITTVAGDGQTGFFGDGASATQAGLFDPTGVTVGRTEVLHFDTFHNRVRRVNGDGVITTVVGNGNTNYSEYSASLTGRPLESARYGSRPGWQDLCKLLLVVWYQSDSALPSFKLGNVDISSADGSEINRFDDTGRQLETLDALTNVPIYTFGYDSAEHLSSVTDADNNITSFQHDSLGNPTAIIGPFGQTNNSQSKCRGVSRLCNRSFQRNKHHLLMEQKVCSAVSPTRS